MESVVDATLNDTTPMAWVIVAILLVVLNHVIGTGFKLLQEWWDHRKGNGLQGSIKTLTEAVRSLESKVADNPPYPPCHYDPTHFDRVRRADEGIEKLLEKQAEHDRQMIAGQFTCRVHGDHLKIIQRLGDRLSDGGKI